MKNQTLILNDGIYLNILTSENNQTFLRYDKASDVKKFQSLSEDAIVSLDNQIMKIKDIFKKIGRDYIPRPIYRGVDDSPEIIQELIEGRTFN